MAKEKAKEKSEKASSKGGERKQADKQSEPGAARTTRLSEETRLAPLLCEGCLIDCKAETKEDLLRTLAETVALQKSYPSAEQIFRSAMEREAVVNTYLGAGVAVPHARVSSFEGFAIAIARNPEGFPYGVETDEPVQVVILLVGNESLQNEHVRVLAAIASAVKDEPVRAEILEAEDYAAVGKILDAGAQRRRRRPGQQTKLLLSHSRRIARDIGATSILVAIENPEELTFLRRLPRKEDFIVATSSARIAELASKLVERVIRLPQTRFHRDALIRVGILMGVAQGYIARDDVVAILSGQLQSGLDTLTVLRVSREFGRFLSASGKLSARLSPGVFERILSLASDLGREGREGRPVGTIFVIGNPEELQPYCQQLVMNPFRGYPEEERNILDPTLEETIKEFSTIDGAFIVREDGVLHSAGTYLRPGEVEVDLPSGFGTRHRAAAAITVVTDSISAVVSETNGQLMFFKKGAAILKARKEDS